MFCATPDYLMNAESTFAKIIGEGAVLEQKNHVLTLTQGDQKMVFQVFMD